MIKVMLFFMLIGLGLCVQKSKPMKIFHLKDCSTFKQVQSQGEFPNSYEHIGMNVREFLENWDIAPTVGNEDGPEWEFCANCVKRAYKFKSLGLLSHPDVEPINCMRL